MEIFSLGDRATTFFVYIFFVTLIFCHGCSDVCVSAGLQATFTYTLAVPGTDFVSYEVSKGSTQLLSFFYNGGSLVGSTPDGDVTVTGDLSTGDVAFTLSNVVSGDAGTYTLKNAVTSEEFGCAVLTIPFTRAQDAGFTFENTGCHYIGDNLILVGTYSGSKTVQAIEWFFDQQIAGNLIIIESTCSLFGAPDAGYPTNRMTYDCTGRPTTYKATISNLDGTEEGEWGVRFSFTDSSISNYDRSPFSLCTGGPSLVSFDPASTSYTKTEGDKLTIHCKSSCNPRCSFTWTKQGQNKTVSTNGTLYFDGIQASDAGNYTCLVRNTYNGTTITKSGTITLGVRYGPDMVILRPNVTTHTIDEFAALGDIICDAYCYPACTYVWTKQGYSSQLSSSVLPFGRRVTRNNAGVYTCIATNPGSNRHGSVLLTMHVRYGPDIVSLTPNVTTHTIDEFAFLDDIKCDADCYPVCTYVWTKQGHGEHISSTSVLSFGRQVTRNYAGVYICIATNPGFNHQRSVVLTIHVRYGPDQAILIPSQTTYTLDMGSSFPRVSCKSDCYPACTSTWHKEGGSTSIATTDGLLALGKLNKTDAGVYICNVTNIQLSQAHTAQVTLHIRYGPSSVSFSPTSLSYTNDEGDKLTIRCTSSCYPGCSFTWTKQGLNTTVSLTGMLYFSNVRISDAGNYTCLVRNTYSGITTTKSWTITLNVRYGPDIVTLIPNNNTHIVDEFVALDDIKCDADCYPVCIYVWIKQGTEGHSSQISTTSVLSFGRRVLRNYAGVYTCIATNPGSNRHGSVVLTIHVRYGPDQAILIPAQTTYTFNNGSSFPGISCTSDCYPACTSTWYKDAESNSIATTNGSLELGKLDKTDAGFYICNVTNILLSHSHTALVTLLIRYGPESIMFVPAVTSQLTIVEGKYKDPISCFSDCYPSCTASWKKGAQNTPLATDEVLSLGYVNRSDTGNFTCMSTNAATEYHKSLVRDIALVVQYPPNAAIKLENENSPDAILKCLANGEPPSYTFERWIHIATDNTTEIQRYTGNVKGSENTLVLKNVTYMDSGYYMCKVSNGISTSTTHFGIDYKEIHVADKPYVIQDIREYYVRQHENVSIAVRFHSFDVTHNITWIKLGNDRNTTVKSDDMYDTSISSEAVTVPFFTKNITLQGHRSQLHIRDVYLGDYAKYEVHIANSAGEEVVMLVVKQIEPPEVPRNFTILQDSETTSSIRFAWFPGFHGGANQTFYIECKPKGQEWRDCARLSGGKLNRQFQLTVDGLASGSSYLFRIYSKNEYGNSTDKSITLLGKTTNEEVAAQQTSLAGPAVGGGLGVAVLIVLVIVGAVFVKRRWTIKAKDVPMQPQVPHDEDGSMQYERLGTQHGSFSPYEVLSTVTTYSGVPQGSGGNMYDDLDSAQDQTHVYASLQVDPKGTTSDAIFYSNLKLTAD